MRFALAIALAMTAFFVLVSPGHAQQSPRCAETDKVMAYYAAGGGKIVGRGVLGSGAELFIIANAEGVFVIILVSPDKSIACEAVQGEGWKLVEPGRGA